MKEIKFRGKRIDNNELIYGDLVHNIYDGNKNIDVGIHIDSCYPVEVIPESVGQFIGRCDHKGNEIYSNDILLSQEYSTKNNGKNPKRKRFKMLIEYASDECGYRTERASKYEPEDLKFRFGQWGDFFDCEVIGNTFDNLELLKC